MSILRPFPLDLTFCTAHLPGQDSRRIYTRSTHHALRWWRRRDQAPKAVSKPLRRPPPFPHEGGGGALSRALPRVGAYTGTHASCDVTSVARFLFFFRLEAKQGPLYRRRSAHIPTHLSTHPPWESYKRWFRLSHSSSPHSTRNTSHRSIFTQSLGPDGSQKCERVSREGDVCTNAWRGRRRRRRLRDGFALASWPTSHLRSYPRPRQGSHTGPHLRRYLRPRRRSRLGFISTSAYTAAAGLTLRSTSTSMPTAVAELAPTSTSTPYLGAILTGVLPESLVKPPPIKNLSSRASFQPDTRVCFGDRAPTPRCRPKNRP
jgi:hypothetical protein